MRVTRVGREVFLPQAFLPLVRAIPDILAVADLTCVLQRVGLAESMV